MSASPDAFRPRVATVADIGAGDVEDDVSVDPCSQGQRWRVATACGSTDPLVRWASGLPGVEVDGGPRWVGRSAAPGSPTVPAVIAERIARVGDEVHSQSPGWWLASVLGPVTTAHRLTDSQGRSALQVPSARGPLLLGYSARLRSLMVRMKEALPRWGVVLLLDEPDVQEAVHASGPALVSEAWAAGAASGADVLGLRCGADPSWGQILDLAPALVAFDASGERGAAASDDPAFRRLISGGSSMVWEWLEEVSPAEPNETDPGDPSSRARDAAGRFVEMVGWSAKDYLPEVLARSLLAPARTATIKPASAATPGVFEEDSSPPLPTSFPAPQERASFLCEVGALAWERSGLG